MSKPNVGEKEAWYYCPRCRNRLRRMVARRTKYYESLCDGSKIVRMKLLKDQPK